ncbi:hypothetical protein [Pseudomarimonas arenosa]|uniref:Secreted protein n=1 Tax=Pseudomarimonas arenosa TaxID=2774145 RepID=A0AAW3ZIR2_9GAMM|nr:hypothetical protein [Pseudomarimonas arenosa]MBD8524830.1 hypothetical protein [Pseudomarimonas arenosa]
MSVVMLLLLVAGVTMAIHMHQSALRARQRAKARRPSMTRIIDPKRQGGRISPVWQLHGNGCQCSTARRLAGQRLAIEDTVALQADGQQAPPCRCYYRPLRDERKSVRRDGSERRNTLRFDLLAQNRRLNSERRQKEQVWKQVA